MKTQAEVDAHAEAAIDAQIAQAYGTEPVEFDGIEQLTVTDALETAAKEWEAMSDRFSARGSIRIAATRMEMAKEARRLRDILLHRTKVVIS